MAGLVIVNEQKLDKAGILIKIDPEPIIRIKGKNRKYVSRGGLKLEKAIKVFDLDFKDKIILDVGASSGGFTHCALLHGAKFVYAVDVGTNQLAWELRSHPQVKSIENTHINALTYEQIDNKSIDFIVVDVSFISIKSIIGSLKKFFSKDTKLVILIKPQFEAKKEDIEKGGIVRKIHVHDEVIHDIILECKKNDLFIENIDYSPITGTKGNVEYISLFSSKNNNKRSIEIESIIKKVVKAGERLGGNNEQDQKPNNG